MTLPVVKYGDPVLRQKGARIAAIDDSIRELIQAMLETMREASGVGLAAQQVGRALQLAVLDVRGVKDRPSTLEWEGHPVAVGDYMPMILINPEINPLGDPVSGPEGCLSFPEMYADISRPGLVEVRALNEKGETIRFRCGGLLARAVQHEVDHLNGILFIDRMSSDVRKQLKPELETLQQETRARMKRESEG